MSVRYFRIAAALALGFAALRAATRIVVWLLPYNTAGLASETALLLIGAGVAVAFERLRRSRFGGTFAWPTAIAIGAVTYLTLSFAGLGWEAREDPGFARNRFYAFSAPGCGLAVRFPNPPSGGQLFGSKGLPGVVGGRYAWLADLDSVSSLRADCLVLDHEPSFDDGRAGLRRLLQQWIDDDGVRVTREIIIDYDDLIILHIEGSIGGSLLPDGTGPGRTFVAARAHIAGRTILVLTIHQTLSFELSQRSRDFLASAYRR